MVTALEVSPVRLTLEERTVVPVTAAPPLAEVREVLEDDTDPVFCTGWLTLWLERDWPEDRTVVPLDGALALLAADELPDEERVALPEERLAPTPLVLLPEERLTLLPEERVAWLLPEERLVEVLLRRSCCCTALPEEMDGALEERFTVLPDERVVVPAERVAVLPEDWLLPDERVVVPEVDRLEELPPAERDWASISGAMSMTNASIMEVARVVKLLIAS